MRDTPQFPGIHPTATVDRKAELGEVVTVGAGAFVGPDVILGDGCTVGANAVVEGPSVFGPGNSIGAMCHLGGDPQDLKYLGGDTRLEVGEGNDFRSFCTVNRGTEHGGGVTRIGDGCLLMHYTHVAHDCTLVDGAVLANSAQLGGHVHVAREAIVAALVGVHQFVHVGRLAMIAAGSMADKDVPPFTIVQGDRARLVGLNVIGLRRAGVSVASRTALKDAYKDLFRRGGVMLERAAALEQAADDPLVAELVAFVKASTRGICVGR